MIQELRLQTLRERCVRLFLHDRKWIMERAANAFSSSFEVGAKVRSESDVAAWIAVLVGENATCFRETDDPLHKGKTKQIVATVELAHAMKLGRDDWILTEADRIEISLCLDRREAVRSIAVERSKQEEIDLTAEAVQRGVKKRQKKVKSAIAEPRPAVLLQSVFVRHHKTSRGLNQDPLSMEQMAALAGCSKPTVSRCLRNKPFNFSDGYRQYEQLCRDHTRLEIFVNALEDPQRIIARLESDTRLALDKHGS